MTNNQIRIAVAEECGWVRQGLYLIPPLNYNGDRDKALKQDCPNYPESLDACAEFEKTIASLKDGASNPMYDPEYVYESNLCSLNKGKAWSATPLQRCEAFLRLKGKWKE